MSRSYKIPVIKCSNKIDKHLAHKKVRHIVKQELSKEKPDELIIGSDTRELGLEEQGTVLGFPFNEIEDNEIKKRCRK